MTWTGTIGQKWYIDRWEYQKKILSILWKLIYYHAKNQKELMTDGLDFIGFSVGRGSNNSNSNKLLGNDKNYQYGPYTESWAPLDGHLTCVSLNHIYVRSR